MPKFSTDGTDGAGNVGIGTTSPDVDLHVAKTGDTFVLVESTDGNAAQIRVKSSAQNRRFVALDENDNVLGQIQFDDSTIRFRFDATDVLAILSDRAGIGTVSPDSKAILDLTSTTLGLLPPRMTTTQRDAISSPPEGLVVYNTTTSKLNVYTGSAWEAVTSS